MSVNDAATLSSSDILASIAILVAICSAIISVVGIVVEKKNNKANLEAIYYETIFKDFLLNRLPEKVSALKFDKNHKLNKNYRELNDTMMEMVRKARYFSFSKPKFYNRLIEMTKELEDYLIVLSNETIVQTTMQKERIIKIEKGVSEIIVHINKNYYSA